MQNELKSFNITHINVNAYHILVLKIYICEALKIDDEIQCATSNDVCGAKEHF